MKNGQWLKETDELLRNIPKQMLAAWEVSNPGACIGETWKIIQRWQKIENYAMWCVCMFLCLAVILAITGSPESEMWPSLTGAGIFCGLMVVTDFRLIGPECRIEELRQSVVALGTCGLIPPTGLRQDGREDVVRFARARLTENALLLSNAQANRRGLHSSRPAEEVGIASESESLFSNRYEHSLKVAVTFGLSSGVKNTHFLDAENRRSWIYRLSRS